MHRQTLTRIAAPWATLAVLAAALLALTHLAGPAPAEPAHFPPALEWPAR